MFIDEFTLVSAYYSLSPSEVEFLFKRFKDFHELRKSVNVSMIIVDDGSPTDPIDEVTKGLDTTGVSLYRVTEDLGFNSHGCRNLGVTESKTQWNLILDLDEDLRSINLSELKLESDEETVYSFSTNTMLMHKSAYFSCNGYDEEYVNAHVGDKDFIDHFKRHYNYRHVPTGIIHMREKREVLQVDSVTKTSYLDERYVVHPIESLKKALKVERKKVLARYASLDFSQKKIINFPWVKVK